MLLSSKNEAIWNFLSPLENTTGMSHDFHEIILVPLGKGGNKTKWIDGIPMEISIGLPGGNRKRRDVRLKGKKK